MPSPITNGFKPSSPAADAFRLRHRILMGDEETTRAVAAPIRAAASAR